MPWEGGGSQAALRLGNRRRIVGLLRVRGPLTRAELARLAGISRSTASAIIADLLATGLVREIGDAPSPRRPGQVGRPGSLVTLDPTAGAAIGVDVDHQHLRVVVADLAHRVLAETSSPLELDHDAGDAMTLAEALVETALGRAAVDRAKVLGVGLALAGPIEQPSGMVRPSSISPSWIGVDVRRAMTERLGLPVFVDNDANLGALAELMWGAARGVVDGAYIRVGTGIGAGLIIGGSVYRGARGTAGEIGHSTIAPDGPVCRCGNRGCLERVAGGRAILQSLAGSHAHELSLDEVLDHALHGEAACRRIISDAGHLVGAQVATLCNLVNPERVVIGGPLSTAGDILLDPLRHTIARSALPIAADTAEVVLGELGDRAAALGAVALVLQTVDPFHDGTEGGGWGGPGTRVREEGLEAIATS